MLIDILWQCFTYFDYFIGLSINNFALVEVKQFHVLTTGEPAASRNDHLSDVFDDSDTQGKFKTSYKFSMLW